MKFYSVDNAIQISHYRQLEKPQTLKARAFREETEVRVLDQSCLLAEHHLEGDPQMQERLLRDLAISSASTVAVAAGGGQAEAAGVGSRAVAVGPRSWAYALEPRARAYAHNGSKDPVGEYAWASAGEGGVASAITTQAASQVEAEAAPHSTAIARNTGPSGSAKASSEVGGWAMASNSGWQGRAVAFQQVEGGTAAVFTHKDGEAAELPSKQGAYDFEGTASAFLVPYTAAEGAQLLRSRPAFPDEGPGFSPRYLLMEPL